MRAARGPQEVQDKRATLYHSVSSLFRANPGVASMHFRTFRPAPLARHPLFFFVLLACIAPPPPSSRRVARAIKFARNPSPRSFSLETTSLAPSFFIMPMTRCVVSRGKQNVGYVASPSIIDFVQRSSKDRWVASTRVLIFSSSPLYTVNTDV